MSAMKKTLLELLVLGVVGLGLGFGVNAVRAKGAIRPTKNYFDTALPVIKTTASNQDRNRAPGAAAPATPPSQTVAPVESLPSQAARNTEAPAVRDSDAMPGVRPAEGANGAPAEKEVGHIQHDYQSIGLKDVIAVFNDPLTAKGLNAFVDARDDQHFEEGHIPGAVQLDSYQVEQYLQAALEKANAAEKVIVYCSGGDCQDSIFACRELLMAGIPYESIYLFEGGWKEWEAADMPVAKGREE